VLALHLRGDVFSDEEKARDFAYYEALTARDSSLSACTQGVIAAEVGHLELAFDYHCEAALIDLDDLQHDTRDGLHIASLAGTWIGAVAGFGGMRDHGGILSFTPRLPQALTRLTFRLCFRGRRLLVEVEHKQATYSLLRGSSLEIVHHGKKVTVDAKRPVIRQIPSPPARETPSQPSGRAPKRRGPPS
jgi:alpha,alpha-trehalose phosphorylase